MAPQKPRPRPKHRTAPPPADDSAGDHTPRKPSRKAKGQKPPPGRRKSHVVEKDKASRPEKRKSAGNEAPRGSRSEEEEDEAEGEHGSSSQRGSNTLSIDSLARLNALNERAYTTEKDRQAERARKERKLTGRAAPTAQPKHRHRRQADSFEQDEKRAYQRRTASGGRLEEAWPRTGSVCADDQRKKKRMLWLAFGLLGLVLAILVPIAIVVANRKKSNSTGSVDGGAAPSAATSPSNSNLGGESESSIPPSAQGTYMDPFTWYDTTDFNVTYTNVTVGGLPIMGLNSTWDDSTQANANVPPLGQKFAYGSMPIRGVNVGGWLSLEPFITPSLFNAYSTELGIIDEWTLTQYLGPTAASETIEKHYSTFINKQAFQEIQAAGFDHVRIPFSYWAVTTYDGDPYVPHTSWRYLLRGIEYARQCGLRVNLDLHGLPGSQNGWNHSGRQGVIGWLNGTDGDLNAQRSLDIHDQLSQFFAQPRYANVLTIYGLVNEPKMIALPTDTVLNWTTVAVGMIRANGLNQSIAVGDGFLGLTNWVGKLSELSGLVLDAHQYVIFNEQQIAYNHTTKVDFACSGWTSQMQESINPSTGFGPTLCGEWSQADTDCAAYLNNVGVGSRWEGTLNLGNTALDDLMPSCPANSGVCECADANAAASAYSSAYKQWLLLNAEAQMASFEVGWGWFYWTWLTEDAVQWSWKLALDAGIVPAKVWQRSFNCSQAMPSFEGLPETY